jgi:hypothetical protein
VLVWKRTRTHLALGEGRVLGVGCWALGVGHCVLGVGRFALGVGLPRGVEELMGLRVDSWVGWIDVASGRSC